MTVPSTFFSTIAATINLYGEELTYFPFDGGSSIVIKGSVQAPLEETLLGDQEQEGFFVFIAQDSLAQPQKFDRLLIRGRERTVEDFAETRISGVNACWVLRVVG